jgi:hypothetical protein
MQGQTSRDKSTAAAFWDRLFREIIATGPDKRPSWSEIFLIGGVYLLGALVWLFFLDFGRLSFDLHDWTQEGPRYDFIRRALIEGRAPLFIGTVLSETNRFLAIPDTILSPQVLLLRFMQPAMFVLVNTLFLYSLGFLGLHLIRKRLGWSALTFGVVSLLFLLCGYPMAHIAVGHSMWASYFLLPYFGLLIFNLYENGGSWRWVGWMSLLQLGFFLQGGFHFVIWSLLFLALIGLFHRRNLRWVVWGWIFSVLLCMVRILPAAVTFHRRENLFISGYFSLTDLLRAFAALRGPEVALDGMYRAVGWWEFDVYIGLVGLVFLLYFGVYRTLIQAVGGKWLGIAAPAIAMVILSMGKIFQPINALPLPLMNAERVSSRFIAIPFMVFLILGGVHFDAWLRGRRFTVLGKAGLVALIIVMLHDLTQHARLWRVARMDVLFARTPVDIRTEVLTLTDPIYTHALWIGAGISLLSALCLWWLRLRERREVPRDGDKSDTDLSERGSIPE